MRFYGLLDWYHMHAAGRSDYVIAFSSPVMFNSKNTPVTVRVPGNNVPHGAVHSRRQLQLHVAQPAKACHLVSMYLPLFGDGYVGHYWYAMATLFVHYFQTYPLPWKWGLGRSCIGPSRQSDQAQGEMHVRVTMHPVSWQIKGFMA